MTRFYAALPLMATSIVLIVLLSAPWLPLTTAQHDPEEASDKMKWISALNKNALCNDFTRAGFFLRRNQSSNKWVVFFESGGLCYNNETCNRRFFVSEVRTEFMGTSTTEVVPYGSFDPSVAWNETILNGRDPAKVISPLMSSMKCFESVREYFPNALNASIEGRDILDVNSTRNPLFYDYNHVVVPYCSSDVWLGEDTSNTEAVHNGTSECQCLTSNSVSNPCFNFNPQSSNLQFTFRGKIIFQSIIQQLLTGHDMVEAERIILAGSSSGGVAVVNHAKWTRKELKSHTQLMVLFDSSWFINFQNGIDEVFNGTNSSEYNLFEILQTQNDACNNTDRFGYPCCVSAHCILTEQNSDGELLYYPKGTPTFALFSIYDVYLLTPALAAIANVDSVQSSGTISTVLDFLRVVGEYGGTMNYTLDAVTAQESFLSYYVTQCFQHVYLATSTLWGETGQTIFGSNSAEYTGGSSSFIHSVSSDRWRIPLAVDDDKYPVTILDALTTWISNNGSGLVQYRDACYGTFCSLCNSQCPDQLILGQLSSNNWHLGIKLFIVVLVIIIAVFCFLVKLAFTFWLYQLEKKLNNYLQSLHKAGSPNHSILQFPHCDDESAISVSCLDLYYSVTVFKESKAFKDEKDDKTAPCVLHNLDDDTDSIEHGEPGVTESSFASQKEVSIDTLKRNIESMNELNPEVGAVVQTNKRFGQVTKKILKGISTYFNPGNMIGIMGPSGSGKTTLLDVITGRRTTGTIEGYIYVNGTPVEEIREWYIANTGYVLQLALPYYEELTVRENLVLAAQLKLPKEFTLREKFERVEQVMKVTGLLQLSKTVVGGTIGPGLSGGQKKRLVVALQLLNLPSVIFLDEPTSGLDAAASLELLTHLNELAESNRTVILTIHQPRLEIFHMFHQLVLLSDGKVSYHDVPAKAYESFVSALTTKYLERGLVIPSLVDVHNPADVIMDMLGSPTMRQIITESYQTSNEPIYIQRAIRRARWKKKSTDASVESLGDAIKYVVHGTKRIGEKTSIFTRMAVLEARAAKRASLESLSFLPIMFFAFGFVLGTTYLQVNSGFLVISGMCVFSTASALFLFPSMYPYYLKALEVYRFERADGTGKAYDLVIQGFVRFNFLAVLPVIFAVSVIYLLLIHHQSYDIYVYLQVLVVNISLCQTWISLLIALICAFPVLALRLSPVIAAVAGFSSGFFIPINEVGWWYRWLSYINPNYYGLSSVAFLVLSDLDTNCDGSQLECYLSSGPYTLDQFSFDKVNPYLHLVVLLFFTIFYLILAIIANRLRHTTITFKLKRVSKIFRKFKNGLTSSDYNLEYVKQSSNLDSERVEKYIPREPLSTLLEEDSFDEIKQSEDTEMIPPEESEKVNLESGTVRAIGQETPKFEPIKSAALISCGNKIRNSGELRSIDDENIKVSMNKHVVHDDEEDSCSYHQVWRPKKRPCLPDLVIVAKELQERRRKSMRDCNTKPDLQRSVSKMILLNRQQHLLNRVQATQAVLQESTDEVLGNPDPVTEKPNVSFREVSRRIISEQKKQKIKHRKLSDIVTQYLATIESERETQAPPSLDLRSPASLENPMLPKRGLYKRSSTRGILGAIPIDEWHKLIGES